MVPETSAISQKSLLLRLLLASLVLTAVHVSLSHCFTSRGELVWTLVPIDVLVLAGLGLIPWPRFPRQPLRQQQLTVSLLVLFPVGLYVGLIRICQSPFSLKECLVTWYFFSVCLELPLLYALLAFEHSEGVISRRFSSPWNRLAKLAVHAAFYSLLFPFLLAILAVHRPKLKPLPYEFVTPEFVQKVAFPSRDQRVILRGEFLTHPRSQGTVIVCHGVGANRGDISVIVQTVFSLGYNVLAFDFRGHGDSDGYTITYGANERLDVLGAYDYCLQRRPAENEPLFALGCSMGGASLLMALPDMPRIRAAVVDSAFADMGLMVERQFRILPAGLRYACGRFAAGIGWLETGVDVYDIRPVDQIEKIRCPVLFIHDTDDTIIPTEHATLLSQHAERAGLTHQLHLEPESPHIGMVIMNPMAYKRLVRRWFSGEQANAFNPLVGSD